MKSVTHPLQDHVGHIKTRMGGAFVGSRAVFRGQDLHVDLKDIDWVELYVLGITGRRFTPEQVKLLHAMWVYTSYPDPRLWNNRVAALAGSARSSGNLGVSAALAVSEASIYGRGIDIRAASFLTETQKKLQRGIGMADCVREELDRYRGLAGYGRPIAAGDERIKPTMQLARSLGLDAGPHVKLAHDVETFLLNGRWRWRMNYAALLAALTSDLGFTPRQHYLFCFPTFLAGMVPCFIEASERPVGTLFPQPCENVSYEGHHKRPWGNQ
ncbi:MAG: citryl-CoA lyase [Rhizobacter sp.]